MKFRLTLLALMLSTFAFCQSLEGRWVNYGFSNEENQAYEFLKGKQVKMYYAGTQIPTEKPVTYSLKEIEEGYLIEMSYTNATNKHNSAVIGLVKFRGKDRIEMEFWDKNNPPKEMEFSDESLIYTKQ